MHVVDFDLTLEGDVKHITYKNVGLSAVLCPALAQKKPVRSLVMYMSEICVAWEKPTRGNQTFLIPCADYGQHVNAVTGLLHMVHSGCNLNENLLCADISWSH